MGISVNAIFDNFIWEDEAGHELFFEDWVEINAEELDSIFAENGADREMDFNYEQCASDIYFNLQEDEIMLHWIS